eukprot:s182_g10.t1
MWNFLILARVGGRRTWKHVRLIRTTSEVFPVATQLSCGDTVTKFVANNEASRRSPPPGADPGLQRW